MSAVYNNEYSVLEQDPKPAEPRYTLLVQLLLNPCFATARDLYWYLVEANMSPYTALDKQENDLKNTLFLLLEVLQHDRKLDTANPLWLVVLRQAQLLAQPPVPVDKRPTVYVVRRMAADPFKLGVFATDSPAYTEQKFPTRAMAEYALYRNQPFTGVYDSYMYNTQYGTSGPKWYRRIVSIPERTRESKTN
jgi:hypothetical protein